MVQTAARAVREFWVVLSSLWLNFVLFGLALVAAAALMGAFGCYPEASFHERLASALYMARLESLPTPSSSCVVSVLIFLMPLLTLLILGEGALRVASLYLGRKHHREEWDRLMVRSLSGHTVLCGAGELGRAVLAELLRRDPNVAVAVVDNHPGVLDELSARGPNLHHIHGDMVLRDTLVAANVSAAATVVLTSGNDAHNLEAAFKVLQLNPQAHIWVRLKHSGLSAMMERFSQANVHFFCPYLSAAEKLAEALVEDGRASGAGG